MIPRIPGRRVLARYRLRPRLQIFHVEGERFPRSNKKLPMMSLHLETLPLSNNTDFE